MLYVLHILLPLFIKDNKRLFYCHKGNRIVLDWFIFIVSQNYMSSSLPLATRTYITHAYLRRSLKKKKASAISPT